MAHLIPSKQKHYAGTKAELHSNLVDREIGFCTEDHTCYIMYSGTLYPLGNGGAYEAGEHIEIDGKTISVAPTKSLVFDTDTLNVLDTGEEVRVGGKTSDPFTLRVSDTDGKAYLGDELDFYKKEKASSFNLGGTLIGVRNNPDGTWDTTAIDIPLQYTLTYPIVDLAESEQRVSISLDPVWKNGLAMKTDLGSYISKDEFQQYKKSIGFEFSETTEKEVPYLLVPKPTEENQYLVSKDDGTTRWSELEYGTRPFIHLQNSNQWTQCKNSEIESKVEVCAECHNLTKKLPPGTYDISSEIALMNKKAIDQYSKYDITIVACPTDGSQQQRLRAMSLVFDMGYENQIQTKWFDVLIRCEKEFTIKYCIKPMDYCSDASVQLKASHAFIYKV